MIIWTVARSKNCAYDFINFIFHIREIRFRHKLANCRKTNLEIQEWQVKFSWHENIGINLRIPKFCNPCTKICLERQINKAKLSSCFLMMIVVTFFCTKFQSGLRKDNQQKEVCKKIAKYLNYLIFSLVSGWAISLIQLTDNLGFAKKNFNTPEKPVPIIWLFSFCNSTARKMINNLEFQRWGTNFWKIF